MRLCCSCPSVCCVLAVPLACFSPFLPLSLALLLVVCRMEAVKDMAALENADATMDVAIKVASPENVVNHDVLIVPNSDEEEDAAFEIKCRRGRNRTRARKVASKSYSLKKMIRRFVNVVVASFPSSMYSLHRLDAFDNLFYPSTVEADAANHCEMKRNGSGNKLSDIGELQLLPPASMFFHQQFPGTDRYQWPPMPNDTFTLLSPRSREEKILRISMDAPAIIYDTDSCSASTIPFPDGFIGSESIFVPIAGGAGGTGKEKDCLYMISDGSFKVLDLNEHPHKWQPLPPLPFAYNYVIESFATLDDGGTICVSITSNGGTYCFDTRTLKWWQAGKWSLPFDGRAEYVQELGSWFGFPHNRHSRFCGHELCASLDLSTMDGHRAPTVQHVWEYLKPLEETENKIVLNEHFLNPDLPRRSDWRRFSSDLLHLGGGRFCVANVCSGLNGSTAPCWKN
ncbi:hypothetical protein QOZ80_7BG0588490 [Eleusine coracana subsp. coracana]|nr:hypothetical protein QOZ80_7BG0588490 [Eleusine coracana subsp. coracana]